jgi:hypothetical protein
VGKSQKQSRRELIEKMQREQARADRRRTILIVVVAIVVGLGIIAYPAIKLVQDARIKNAQVADIGTSMAAASCDAPTDDPATGGKDHVNEGTVVKYAQSPPSSGQHYPQPAVYTKRFYDASDRPRIETLVHNLEHGFTILWYDDTIAGDKKQMDQLERMGKAKLPAAAADRVIIAPFHASDGAAWPDGKHIAFSHWDGGQDPTDASKNSTQHGHRQFCGKASGEALTKFIEKYPATNAPEAGA